MLVCFRFIILVLMGWILPLQGSPLSNSSHIKVELIAEEETVQPNHPFWVALHLKLEEGWHVYWKNPGDAGIPLKVEWHLPEGFQAGPLQWPFPEKFTMDDMVGFGYEGEVTLLSLITPPAQLKSDQPVSLQANINWLVCSPQTCQPGSAQTETHLKISEKETGKNEEFAAIFSEARAKIPQTHVEVKTVRKQGIVQLEVQDQAESQGEVIQEAYFFPEQKNVIDHSIEPTVAQSASDNTRYLVNLKGSDEIGADVKRLKGVLVLRTQNGPEENIQAINIDTHIEDEEGHSLLSFLDHSQENSLAIGNDSVQSTASSSFEGGLIWALAFAFVGGMILNLMPCVLPVMSLKIMSFVKMAGQSRSLTLKHGLVFSFGVILSFWILASLMLVLRTYGQAVGWGFQLQEPLFVVILASLLFIFALSLFGLFEWGMFFASWAGQTQVEKSQKKTGYAGSFFNGVLATAVATPCTGPFLGSAVGFAVTLPIYQAMMIFTTLGLGMCFPYLILSAFPSFLRFMPKPGPWMETFKHLMGFLLLATVLWLLWVFSAQTNSFSLICILAGFLFFSIGAWIYGQGCSPISTGKKRILSFVFVCLFMFVGSKAILLPRATWYSQGSEIASLGKKEWAGWEEFSPERLAQLRSEGKPVLIDFTAKWCLTCQANHLVLDSDSVKKELEAKGVVKMKADWTKNDPVITQELSKYGRNSVPLYVLYGEENKKEPVILPQLLTSDIVAEHVEKAIPAGEVALKEE